MRVRMLQTHEVSTSHPEHGALTLIFAAGSTQHFDDNTAKTLIDSKKADAYPEDSHRVRMLRTITEVELAEFVTASRAREGIAGRVVASPGTEAHRYGKGELVHFPEEAALALTEALDAEGNAAPVAVLDADEEFAPIDATRAAAIEDAIARQLAAQEVADRRAAIKAKSSAAVKSAGSGQSASATSSASTSAATPSTSQSNGATKSEA